MNLAKDNAITIKSQKHGKRIKQSIIGLTANLKKEAIHSKILTIIKNNQNPFIREKAVFMLNLIEKNRSLLHLPEILKEEHSDIVQLRIINYLSKVKSKSAYSILLNIFQYDSNPDFRIRALNSLVENDVRNSFDFIIKRLNLDNNPRVRIAITNIIMKYKIYEAIPDLITNLKTEKIPEVKISLILSLGYLRAYEAIPLIKTIKSKNVKDPVSCASVITLAKLGVNEVLPDLLRLIKHSNQKIIRTLAIRELWQYKSDKVIFLLKKLAISNSDFRISTSALLTLEKTGESIQQIIHKKLAKMKDGKGKIELPYKLDHINEEIIKLFLNEKEIQKFLKPEFNFKLFVGKLFRKKKLPSINIIDNCDSLIDTLSQKKHVVKETKTLIEKSIPDKNLFNLDELDPLSSRNKNLLKRFLIKKILLSEIDEKENIVYSLKFNNLLVVNSSTIQILKIALKDVSKSSLKIALILILNEIDNHNAISTLTDLYKNDHDIQVRSFALLSLFLVNPLLQGFPIDGIINESNQIQIWFLLGLRKFVTKKHIPILKLILEKENNIKIRKLAYLNLAIINTDESNSILLSFINIEKNTSLEKIIIKLLSYNGYVDFIPILFDLFEIEKDWDILNEIVNSFVIYSKITNEISKSLMKLLDQTKSNSIRAWTALALAKIGNKDAILRIIDFSQKEISNLLNKSIIEKAVEIMYKRFGYGNKSEFVKYLKHDKLLYYELIYNQYIELNFEFIEVERNYIVNRLFSKFNKIPKKMLSYYLTFSDSYKLEEWLLNLPGLKIFHFDTDQISLCLKDTKN